MGGFGNFALAAGSAAGAGSNALNGQQNTRLRQQLVEQEIKNSQQQNQGNALELQKQQMLMKYAQSKGMSPEQTAQFLADPGSFYTQQQKNMAQMSTAMAYHEMAAQETDPKKRHAWEMAAMAVLGGAPKDGVQNILKSAGMTVDDSLAAERNAAANEKNATANMLGKVTNLIPGSNPSGGGGGGGSGALNPVPGKPGWYTDGEGGFYQLK